MQLLALRGVERSKELVLQPRGERAQPRECALAVARQADEVSAPVVGIALALEEALLLELVEQADERAAVVAERVGDRRLGLGHALVEQRENCVVIRAQTRLLVLVEGVLLGAEAKPLEQDEARRAKLCGQAAAVGLDLSLH